MKAVPGTLRTGGATFAATRWSVVAACCAEGEEEAEVALTQLCQDYWPPLYTFVRRRGYSPADAQDLVQGFFACLLANKSYAQTDRAKGKFRTFLLASCKHFLADVWDRQRALKRGGGHEFILLDEEVEKIEALFSKESEASALTEEQQYEQRWAMAVVARALQRIDAEFIDQSKRDLFHRLRPFLMGGASLPSQDETARDLNMPIATLRSHLSRLRDRYRQLLRDEVARTIAAVDNVDEEMRHLRSVLAARG
ncbi:MAG: RNA polymerase sigma factor [Chthoniobacterales bacterium]